MTTLQFHTKGLVAMAMFVLGFATRSLLGIGTIGLIGLVIFWAVR